MSEAKRRKRVTGYVVYVGHSATGGFWAVLKGNQPPRTVHFAYGKNFLDHPYVPQVGEQVTFIELPPLPGTRLLRATEISRKGS